MANYATPPSIDLETATQVMEPPESGEGNWVGAPCVHRHDGRVYLAVRERTPEERGHAVAIYEWDDGDCSERTRITAGDLDVVSIERPALVTDPDSGELKLYLPVDEHRNSWRIQKLADVDEPRAFDPSTARDVLRPAAGHTDRATVKDPVVITVGGEYHMFYAGADATTARAHHATSVDGEAWSRRDEPVVDSQYWHDERTRITCVIPAPDAPVWYAFYDGSGTTDYGSTWNLRTGLAVSHDLRTFTDVSPNGPVYSSPVADHRIAPQTFATCRYMDVLQRGATWDVFFEMTREDGSFALYHQSLDVTGVSG